MPQKSKKNRGRLKNKKPRREIFSKKNFSKGLKNKIKKFWEGSAEWFGVGLGVSPPHTPLKRPKNSLKRSVECFAGKRPQTATNVARKYRP